MAITTTELARKRAEVNDAYYIYGFHSVQYHQSFDELHDMNLLFMAERFRRVHGLPPGSRTPYC